MKANALEKIYISPGLDRRWYYPEKVGCYDTEYIRTDAFIEKTKKWLYLQLNEINMKGEDMENFLKDFKKYMEE